MTELDFLLDFDSCDDGMGSRLGFKMDEYDDIISGWLEWLALLPSFVS